MTGLSLQAPRMVFGVADAVKEQLGHHKENMISADG
jgi:hypothetical protein